MLLEKQIHFPLCFCFSLLSRFQTRLCVVCDTNKVCCFVFLGKSETDIRVSVSLFFTSVNGVFLSLCVSLFRVCVCVYDEVCKVPSS